MKKICTACKENKQRTDFGKRKGTIRPDCKECVNNKSREYTKNNKDKVKKAKDKWKKNNKELVKKYRRTWHKKNRDKIIKYKKEFYAANSERLNNECREYHYQNKGKNNARSRKWHKENPEKSRALNTKRRDKERKLDRGFFQNHVFAVFSAFKNQCFSCKSKTDLCIDHHMCLSSGYGLAIGNAVVLCRSCNSSKGTKMPEEFYNKKEIMFIKKTWKIAQNILDNS